MRKRTLDAALSLVKPSTGHCHHGVGGLYSCPILPLTTRVRDIDFPAARDNMVKNQIRPNQVTDHRVISAMSEVPREPFVPESLRGIAYVDEDLALANARYLMEPLVLARLIQAAMVRPTDVVLDIGCATGYSSAVLARLANTVVALEYDRALAATATETLTRLGIETVAVVEGPLADGYAEQGPYDAILFSGAVPEVPGPICDQLAEDGRLVAVISGERIGKGISITRRKGLLSRIELFEAATPILPGFERQPAFTF